MSVSCCLIVLMWTSLTGFETHLDLVNYHRRSSSISEAASFLRRSYSQVQMGWKQPLEDAVQLSTTFVKAFVLPEP